MNQHPFSRRLRRPSSLLAACVVLACGHPSGPHGSIQRPPGPDAGSGPVPADAGTSAVQPTVCSVDGWCWGGQSLQGNTLRAVAASSASDVWIVGALGLTLHFDGQGWSSHWAPQQKTLRGVWRQGDELWAVGDEAQLLELAGDGWAAVPLADVPAGTTLRAVTGDGSGRMWVVGDGGLMLERRAGSWARVDVGTAQPLNAVWADGEQAWAVGDAGTVLRLVNDAWQPVDAGTTRKLTSVHGRGSELWLVGEAGEMRRWDSEGERWQRPEGEGASPRGDLLSVQVADAAQVYAASSDGNVYHWDGEASCPVPGDAGASEPCARWLPLQPSGGERPIFGLWASGERSVAVGEHGLLVSFEGRERTVLGDGSLDNLLDVAGSGPDDVWVAGDRLLQRRDGGWADVLRDSPRAVYALDVHESGRVLVAGTGGMARSYAAASWVSMDVRADALLRGLWSDGAHGWLVGSRGQTWGLLNERLWTPLVTPTERDLLAVWSSPTGTAWAVGEAGVILRHDGTGWAAIPSGPDGGLTVDLRGVWGAADDDVWAVGTGGTVVHWDGRIWGRAMPDATFALNDVWGLSGADAWAVGSGGTILHFDGQQWLSEASGSEHALNAIWGTPERVWAVGEHGTILFKRLQ